jgi:hypothetical protein
VEEAKAAIDRYFNERNEHFRLNPKRAGNRIWEESDTQPHFPIPTTAKIRGIDDFVACGQVQLRSIARLRAWAK